MRARGCLVLAASALVACTDDADVSMTIVHAAVSGCTRDVCNSYVLYEPHCGYDMELIGDDTRDAFLYTFVKADAIERVVQVQYSEEQPPSASGPHHIDQALARGDQLDVGAAYDEAAVLYRLTSAGEVVDLDTTRLVAAPEGTYRFSYAYVYNGTAPGPMVVEDHVIDTPRSVHVEVEEPPPCCSVGRPADLGALFGVVAVVLRRRKRRAGRRAL